MARPKNQFPALKWHAGDKQYCIYRRGTRLRLGDDRAKAEARRLAIIAQEIGQDMAPTSVCTLSLDEAIELYREHLKKLGTDKRKIARVDAAIIALENQGHKLAVDFRGPGLKLMRENLIKRIDKRTGRPLSRRYINHLVDAVVLAFRWLVANDLAPSENLTRLREMSAELAETAGGRETGKTAAVEESVVAHTLPYCHSALAAMIQIQQAAGMRPGELCSMRRREISTRPDEFIPVAGLEKKVAAIAFDGELIWLYCPSKHKNLHRSKPRVIALGGDAQRILAPLLKGLAPDDPVFQSERGRPFTPATYGNAIARAIRQANLKRHVIDRWSPQQLRKAAAKRVDAALGKDGADKAAAMLGHSASRQALDFYITEQIEKAVEAAKKAG